MSTAVKRACDACHRRKVKCDGINPCRNCSSSQLSCTYNAIPQKKGPKGSRAKVISELRETQRKISLSAKVHSRLVGIPNSPPSPALGPMPGLLSVEMVRVSVDFFFANMYFIMPLFQRARLEQQVAYMDGNHNAYCLLTSLSAFMVLQPGMKLPVGDGFGLESMTGASIVSATLLVEEALRVRKAYDYMQNPTYNTMCTSWFLVCCFYALDMHEKAWYYLREATTFVVTKGLDKEESYNHLDGVESARHRRLYWLLFVMERVYGLRRGHPVTLQATINPPTLVDDPTDPLTSQLGNFVAQVNLFRPFDNAMLALWNKTKSECSRQLLATLQKQLRDVLPAYLNNQQAQLSELPINAQWLKDVNWQINVATESGDSASQYQVDITRHLLPMVSHFPNSRLGLQDLSLVEKMTSVAYSLTEYLPSAPASRDPFAFGPRQQLHQVLNVVSMLRSGDHRFLPLLLSRLHDILPRQAHPMLQNAPDNASLCNAGLLDGFGNAGMARAPVLPQDEYETKFVPRVENMSPNSSSPHSPSQRSHEMTPPFVVSPPVMPPNGMDVPHTMTREYSSISNMVMAPPINHAPSPGKNTQIQQHPHQPRPPLDSFQQHLNTPMQNLNPNLSNPPQNLSHGSRMLGLGQGVGSGIGNTMGGAMMNRGNRMPRQTQRANSFALPTSQIRTVEDFHAVGRASTALTALNSLGISQMPVDIDFSDLSR